MSYPSHWLWILGVVLVAGCNSNSTPDQFQTYDKLLTQEQSDSNPKAPPDVSADPPSQTGADTYPDTVTATAGTPSDVTDDEPVFEIPASALAPLNIVDGSSTSAILKVADREPAESPISAVSVTTTASPTPATPLAQPGGIKLLIPKQEFRQEGREQAYRVSYDDLDLLKVLNMEPVPADATNYFPDWLSNLNGKQIRIRGFMYPTFESSGIEQFVLARDNQICCFGRDPKVYDLIAVTMKPGKTTDYIPNRPFDVVGTFRIDLLAEGGKPLGLYWLEDAHLIDR